MKKLVLLFICCMLPVLGYASEGNLHLDKADVDVNNKEALQRGAKYFVNYCMGCHSLKYMTYGRMAKDLGLSKEQVFKNLFWSYDDKQNLGQYMTISMPEDKAKEWFGTAPPDLTLATRNRGADWLYTYLRSFYVDPNRPTGVNNIVFPNVGMPDVLWQLEGMKKAKYETAHGGEAKEFVGFERVSDGTMKGPEFDQAVRDLVTFLAYAGEPGREAHRELGVWVLLFLFAFLPVAYALKKEYWKDVH